MEVVFRCFKACVDADLVSESEAIAKRLLLVVYPDLCVLSRHCNDSDLMMSPREIVQC